VYVCSRATQNVPVRCPPENSQDTVEMSFLPMLWQACSRQVKDIQGRKKYHAVRGTRPKTVPEMMSRPVSASIAAHIKSK
jgi:hypothetical protein